MSDGPLLTARSMLRGRSPERMRNPSPERVRGEDSSPLKAHEEELEAVLVGFRDDMLGRGARTPLEGFSQTQSVPSLETEMVMGCLPEMLQRSKAVALGVPHTASDRVKRVETALDPSRVARIIAKQV